MAYTLKGIIQYDGTGFHGWQRQPGLRTVQGALETALSQIADRPVAVQGSGRTDAGVHAFGQVFSCAWPRPLDGRLRHALSKMLGPEVWVVTLEEAAEGFNARFAAVSKRYAYALDLSPEPNPFAARYAWHVPYALDLDRMAQCLQVLVGEHDFAGFQSTGHQMEKTVRTLFSAEVKQGGILHPVGSETQWRLEFWGDGFLYHMVRNITGSLVEIGRGRYSADFLREQLEQGGPFRGHCAPARGLALMEVRYA